MSRNAAGPCLSVLQAPSLGARLAAQLVFSASEARRDPFGFLRSLVAGDSLDHRSRRTLWSIRLGVPLASGCGFALGIVVYIAFIGVSPSLADTRNQDPDNSGRDVVLVAPRSAPSGGGSGHQNPTPVSRGAHPPSSLVDPVVAATTMPVPPPLNPLAVPPPVKSEPTVPLPGRYGDPSSAIDTRSDGPGTGGSAGTGTGPGWGAGPGPGFIDGNSGGPGGRGVDPVGGSKSGPSAVATKAVILNAPKPSYTEQARANKTEGLVTVRVLLGADGRVREARVAAGLPDGLNERAIEAATHLVFRPALNSGGRPVDSWITVSVRFTIR